MKRILIAVVCAGFVSACSANAKSPDVTSSIRQSLDQKGFKDVSVSQDRDKGIVTLGGHVSSDADKAQAESVAKDFAAGQVVADQIVVTPPGNESDAKEMSSALDSAIEQNIKAKFLEHHISDAVKYSSKAGSVTLTGNVDSDATKREAATVASQIPNVKQVINELQVKK
jgi:osmotically-inducible protein OsmY